MKNVEIERKWLLESFPNLPYETAADMEQGYLTFTPNTVRIRRTTENGHSTYILNIKGKGRLTRAEVETEITAGQYEALKDLLAGPPVRKTFRTYRLPDGRTLECSLVDEGEPTSFYYAEVEFDNEEEAHAFVPPDFLGREVTEVPGYSMAEYSRSKAEGKPFGG